MQEGLKTLLEIDDLQANAILDMQLRRLAALGGSGSSTSLPSTSESSPT